MIVGFGRLAQALIDVLPSEYSINIFSRTKERVIEKAADNPRIGWISPEKFNLEKEVWLLLPAEAIPDFIKTYSDFFNPDTTFFYCATKGMSREIKSLITASQKLVPVKFITEAKQLSRDKRGMAAIPLEFLEYKEQLQYWFKNSMEVVIAEEEDVLLLNKTTTTIAIELMESLNEELKESRLSDKLINHAAQQIVPGVIQSYIEGRLGGFGEQVLKERNERRHENR